MSLHNVLTKGRAEFKGKRAKIVFVSVSGDRGRCSRESAKTWKRLYQRGEHGEKRHNGVVVSEPRPG